MFNTILDLDCGVELLDVDNNLTESTQVGREILLDKSLIRAQLGVEVGAVRASLHGHLRKECILDETLSLPLYAHATYRNASQINAQRKWGERACRGIGEGCPRNPW